MKQSTRRRIVCALSLILFFATMILLTLLFQERLLLFVKDPLLLRAQIDEAGFWGWLIFTGAMAAQVVLAIIPGHPFEVAAGICFGVWLGVILTALGAALGSAVNFALARIFGMKALTTFYPPEKTKKLFFLKESKRRNLYTFITFLVPGIPKDMLAYFMGMTSIRFWDFMLFSTLGRLPGILIAVIGGAAILERSVPLFILLALLLILITALAVLLYRTREREAERFGNSGSDDSEK